MKALNTIAVTLAVLSAIAIFTPSARADVWDQMTKMTFSQPVEIPGRVLPAGSYWFVLQNNASDRNIVQIFSSNWTRLYATEITASALRMRPTGRTEIKFAERRHDKPEALLDWYYPGLLYGHEFVYLRRQEQRLAHDVKVNTFAKS
jgi:hypothetical protein